MKKHIGLSKSSQAVQLSIDLQTRLRQSITVEHGAYSDQIDKFLGAKSLNEQLMAVKKMAELPGEESLCVMEALLTLFSDSSLSKNNLHKVVGSCLDTVCMQHECLQSQVKKYISHLSTSKDVIFALKHLIESPPNSIRCKLVFSNLQVYLQLVMTHLLSCLSLLTPSQDDEQSGNSSGVTTESVALAHTIAQLFYRLLSSPQPISPADITHIDVWKRLISELQQSLLHNRGNMDLQITIGLCLAMMTAIESTQHEDASLEYRSQISHLMNTCDVPQKEDNSHLFYKCCILNGIVRCHQLECTELHELILTHVQQICRVKMYAVELLVFTKLLVSWTQWLGNEKLSSFVCQSAFEPVFNYLFYIWEHSSEAIRQDCRAVYSNLLQAVKTNHEQLANQSLQTILSYPWTCKGKYGFLMEYVSIYGMSKFLAESQQTLEALVESFVSSVEQQQLANYVSELLSCMMSVDKKEQIYSREEWRNTWLKPLITSIQHNPSSHKHVSQNLLPKIMKVWPETIVDMIRQLSGESEDNSTTDCLDMYLMLSSHARKSGLLNESETCNSGFFCGVLSVSLIEQALHSHISERRLAAFALVCQSHKTASPISSQEFEWVLQFLLDNSFHTEPSFRQQMLSHTKHFLFHVLESSRKLDTQQQVPYNNFLKQLGEKQIERLNINGLANHRTVAIDILTLMSNIFPYTSCSNRPTMS